MFIGCLVCSQNYLNMECISPRYLPSRDAYVPCGKCACCGATKRSDWALRLHYEGKLHLTKRFVTLTYADPHLVWRHKHPQLCKRHVQLWLKRIRHYGKVRYYAVGEYGSKTLRPHYHVILFGEVPESVLQSEWPHGHVHVGNVNQASIMYCLGYLVCAKGVQVLHNRVAPFSLMSRRPGLGANYLTAAMQEWHKADRRNYSVVDGEKRHLPRYYKEKIFSKIDLVRISVQSQKDEFKRLLEWIREPSQMAMKDPMAYRREQMRLLAESIRSKTKLTHII